MGKREIVAALKRKGLEVEHLDYLRTVSPEEIVGVWEVKLAEDSEAKVLAADPDANIDPDIGNTEEALEWVDTLPDCRG